MNFSKARFHEATLNHHTHAWIFPSLSIASYDSKQHLSEVVFSTLVGFSLYGKWGNDLVPGSYPYTQDPSTVIMVFVKSGSLFMEPGMSWVYGYDPGTKSFWNFPYNENPTRALNIISLKCCLPSTDAIDSREKTHACVWRFKVVSWIRASLKSTRFSHKKVGYFSNRLHRNFININIFSQS